MRLDLLRTTEFLDFLNRKKLPDKFEYSHLELWEVIKKDGKKKIVLKKGYKDAKRKFRAV